ncbi:MAG: hypothetical protein WCJ24_00025 [Candidatus Saccharibacteria bacterium]
MAFKVSLLNEELGRALARPWRLPLNLLLSAAGTLAGITIGVLIHTYHRGLPYAAANIFIWSLAFYNASQLGADADKVLKRAAKGRSLKSLFLYKNLALLIIAIPIDLALITFTCWVINDWNSYWFAILLAIIAVIISLGLGNIVSVVWVYKPASLWKMRHDRVRLVEYGIFLLISYLSATLALLLAFLPSNILLQVADTTSVIQVVSGIVILLSWAIFCWAIALGWANQLAFRYSDYFLGRLNGQTIKINNARLKKILKA